MKDSQYIEIKIDGSIDGDVIKPNTIDIGRYKQFLSDIEDLISGENSDRDRNVDKINIEVIEGSFLVRAFVASYLLIQISAEIGVVSNTNRLNEISPKRAKVINTWQKRSKKKENINYEISLGGGEQTFAINKETNWAYVEDIWYQTELYLYGEIQDWGGVSKSNIHLLTSQYGKVIIDCEKEDIAKEETNRVYNNSLLHIKAKQNLSTGEIKDARLISFLEYNPSSIDLDALKEKGKEAWNGIGDGTKWKRDLRGEL